MKPLNRAVVVVTGGRDYADKDRVWEELGKISPSWIFTGGAKGADRLAEGWAIVWAAGLTVFRADWLGLGAAAGPRRNLEMLAEAKRFADEHGHSLTVLAFPGGKGTAHCSAAARSLGFVVREVTP